MKKAKKKNKKTELTPAIFSRLSPNAKKKLQAELSPSEFASLSSAGQKSEGTRQKAKRHGKSAGGWGEKQFEVSFFAPAVGRRVTYDRLVSASNKQGAISEVKSWLRSSSWKENKGATNFVAKRRNPKARVAAKAPRPPATAAESPRRTSKRNHVAGEVEAIKWICPECGFVNDEEFLKGKVPATLTCGRCGKRSKRKGKSQFLRGWVEMAGPKQNPQQKFSKATLAHLRKQFREIDNADLEKHRADFDKVFAGTSRPLLKQLAEANIEWLSTAAKNALVSRRNPAGGKKKNLHPLEVGSNLAMIVGGLLEVRREMAARSKKKKAATGRRTPKKKNIGLGSLISVAESIQAADYLHKRLGKKKEKNPFGFGRSKQPYVFDVIFSFEHGQTAGEMAFVTMPSRKRFLKAARATAARVSKSLNRGELRKIRTALVLTGDTKPPKWLTSTKGQFVFKKPNPTNRKTARKAKTNPNDGRIFQEFTGKPSEKITTGFHTRKSEPKNIDELGDWSEVKLGSPTRGPVLRFLYPVERKDRATGKIKTVLVYDRTLIDERGREINPKRVHYLPNWIKLCAKESPNGNRRLVVAQRERFFLPNGADQNKRLNYGPACQVSYRQSKEHLYKDERTGAPDKRVHGHYHDLGEEGGRLPRLILDDGWFAFEGGDYKIHKEGIRN